MQARATPPMAAFRLARRERPRAANAALQSLARERTTIPCGLCLALVALGRSEPVKTTWTEYYGKELEIPRRCEVVVTGISERTGGCVTHTFVKGAHNSKH